MRHYIWTAEVSTAAAIPEHIVIHHVDEITGRPTGLVTVEKVEKQAKKAEGALPALHREILVKERNIIQKLT